MTPSNVFFALACIYWGLVEAWMRFRERGSVTASQDRNSRAILVVLIGLGIYIEYGLARNASYVLPGNTLWYLAFGGIVILCGTTLRAWSIRTLGRYFRSTVMIQPGHEVVTAGPYQYVRHPSYSGILLNVLGVGIGLGSWPGLPVLLIFTFLGLYQRIRVEEHALGASLGQPYQDYMRRTKRLIPFLY